LVVVVVVVVVVVKVVGGEGGEGERILSLPINHPKIIRNAH